MQEKTVDLRDYVKLLETEKYVILLYTKDGRTYSYDKETGEIKLRDYWD